MVAIGDRLEDGLLPLHKLTEAAREALEVFLVLVFWHTSGEHSADGDHDGCVSADEQRLRAIGVLVGFLDKVLEGVRHAIM